MLHRLKEVLCSTSKATSACGTAVMAHESPSDVLQVEAPRTLSIPLLFMTCVSRRDLRPFVHPLSAPC